MGINLNPDPSGGMWTDTPLSGIAPISSSGREGAVDEYDTIYLDQSVMLSKNFAVFP